MSDIQMQYQLHMTRGQPDDEAIRMIREFEGLALEYDPRGYCVCTSEGKDSRVLGHLFRRAGVKHFYLHSITGLDPPELVYFQRRNFQTYRDMGYLTYDVMYEMSMPQLMQKKKIAPLRQKRFCCVYLKERRTIEQAQAILSFGVRKYESTKRKSQRDELEIVNKKEYTIMPFDNDESRKTFENCTIFSEKRLNPIAYWPAEYIWDYSKEARMEQCNVYSEGFDRLGCIGCPQAGQDGRCKEFERWPAFKKLWILWLGKTIEARKKAGLQPYRHGQTAEEWFEWWISDRAQEEPVDEDQMTIGDEF